MRVDGDTLTITLDTTSITARPVARWLNSGAGIRVR
jgi:hypothetical protein